LHVGPFVHSALAFGKQVVAVEGFSIEEGWRSPKDTPPRMKASEFRDEARRAWAILAFYEAVLNGDAPAVKNLFVKLRDDKVFAFGTRSSVSSG
jgi:hypothetical protein